jgi:hypothetical protein
MECRAPMCRCESPCDALEREAARAQHDEEGEMEADHVHESYSSSPVHQTPDDEQYRKLRRDHRGELQANFPEGVRYRPLTFHCRCGAVRVRMLPFVGRAEWETTEGRIEEGRS